MHELTTEVRNSKRKAQLSRLTHSEVVRIALENDIFTGRLAPGTAIDEDGLSRRFSVSRTPVREAIFQLVQAGLLEKRSRQGATVAKLELRRLMQMFETIAELEGTCARLAARRITQDELQALLDTHAAAQRAMDAADEDEYAALGRRFHAQILNASHNEVLIEITSKLAAQVVPYRRFQLRRSGRVRENQSDHEAVLDAMRRHASDEVYELMRRHGTIQGDVLVDFISLEDKGF